MYVGVTIHSLVPWEWNDESAVRFLPDVLQTPVVWWLNASTVVVFALALYFIIFGPLFLAIFLRSDAELDSDLDRTLGEQLLGLTPVRPRSDAVTLEPFVAPIDSWRLQLRWLLHLHTLYLPFGILRMTFSRARQTWGDKWTGVIVLAKGADLSQIDCQQRPSVQDRT